MTTMDTLFAGYHARHAALEATLATNPWARGVAWIEGALVPLHEARIPLLDQGFLHGDLTYDVPSVWDGRFFRLADHLARLEASCAKMRLRLPLPADEVTRLLVDMVRRSGLRDAFVELIVTRGLQGVRGHQRTTTTTKEGEGAPGPGPFQNNLYLFIQPFVWVMPPHQQPTGGHAIVARTVRRTPPGAMDPTVKNLQWGDLTRGLWEAADRGAEYPFLTDGDAHLTEGAGFNIVLVHDGALYTPARGCLEGVTRRCVLEAAQALGVPVHVDFVPVEMAYRCDEIFMCTTAGGIMPITELDGKPVGRGGGGGSGQVGPLTRKIWDAYWAMHYDDRYSFAIDYNAEGAAKPVNGV